MMARVRLIDVASLGTLVAAAVLAGMATRRVMLPEPLPEPVAPALDPPTLDTAVAAMSFVLDSITDHDPLHPGRHRIERPSFAPVAVAAEPQAQRDRLDIADIQLVGTTVRGGDNNFALIRQSGQPARIVRVGDTIGGSLVVKAVERSVLILVDSDTTVTIRLSKPW